MSVLTDLDAVATPDIEVRFGGHNYAFPGDVPSEQMVAIYELGRRFSKAADKFEASESLSPPADLRKLERQIEVAVKNLFRIRQPDLTDEDLPLTPKQVQELLEKLIAFYAGTDGEDDRPTTPPSRKNSKRSAPRSNGAKSLS